MEVGVVGLKVLALFKAGVVVFRVILVFLGGGGGEEFALSHMDQLPVFDAL